MLQEILTYLIVAAAFGLAFYKILQSFTFVGKKPTNAAKCGSCSGGCEIKELHGMKMNKFVKPNKYQYYRQS